MEAEVDRCVHGYHVYKDMWDAAIGEELYCRPERNNTKDQYAVAVVKDDYVRSWPFFLHDHKFPCWHLRR